MNLKFKTNLLFTKSLNLYLKAYSSVKFYFVMDVEVIGIFLLIVKYIKDKNLLAGMGERNGSD